MRTSTLPLSVAVSLVAAFGSPASAQQRERAEADDVAVKTDALEIAIASVYVQDTGTFGSVMADTGNVVVPGAGAELSIGVRLTPNLAIAGYATIAGLPGGSTDTDIGVGSVGVKADWHFQPRSRTDAWISLGAGVKRFWLGGDDRLDSELQGIELAKLQVGVDYRIDSSFAIGPVASASATMFTHERTSAMSDFAAIDDKDISYSVSIGLLGRFDFFGSRR